MNFLRRPPLFGRSARRGADRPLRSATARPDWGDLGLGPNRSAASLDGKSLLPEVALGSNLIIDQHVAQTFNAYAALAWPREIGGLLRLRQEGAVVRAIDVKIFPHVAASAAYFELDGEAIARFNLDLVRQGRGAEIAEWKSLIHSHPNMAPFLSGTDRRNIFYLAGPTYAWSVICSAHEDPQRNYFAAHYAQSSPVKLLVRDIPVLASDGQNLGGINQLSLADLRRIESDITDAFRRVGPPQRRLLA